MQQCDRQVRCTVANYMSAVVRKSVTIPVGVFRGSDFKEKRGGWGVSGRNREKEKQETVRHDYFEMDESLSHRI